MQCPFYNRSQCNLSYRTSQSNLIYRGSQCYIVISSTEDHNVISSTVRESQWRYVISSLDSSNEDHKLSLSTKDHNVTSSPEDHNITNVFHRRSQCNFVYKGSQSNFFYRRFFYRRSQCNPFEIRSQCNPLYIGSQFNLFYKRSQCYIDLFYRRSQCNLFYKGSHIDAMFLMMIRMASLIKCNVSRFNAKSLHLIERLRRRIRILRRKRSINVLKRWIVYELIEIQCIQNAFHENHKSMGGEHDADRMRRLLAWLNNTPMSPANFAMCQCLAVEPNSIRRNRGGSRMPIGCNVCLHGSRILFWRFASCFAIYAHALPSSRNLSLHRTRDGE